jgi:hypothetical protein
MAKDRRESLLPSICRAGRVQTVANFDSINWKNMMQFHLASVSSKSFQKMPLNKSGHCRYLFNGTSRQLTGHRRQNTSWHVATMQDIGI